MYQEGAYTLNFKPNEGFYNDEKKPPVRTMFPKGKPRPIPRPRLVTLEEHFENFADVVNDIGDNVHENFFKGLRKLISERSAIKNKKKLAKADVIQAKADAERIRANADAQAAIIAANAAAAQAAQTNQLNQAIYPGSAPVTANQTPMYQTIDDEQPATNPNVFADKSIYESGQVPIPPGVFSPIPKEQGKPKTKNQKIIFAVIAIVVVAAGIYFFKYRKK